MERKTKISLALSWTIIVFCVCLMSFGEVNSLSALNIPNADKIIHVGLYFVLSTMWSWALYKSKNKVHFMLLLVFLVSITIGVLIEFLQEFCTEVRTFEILDIYANTTGALLGVLFFYLLKCNK